MMFDRTLRLSFSIPLLLAAGACVPEDGAPKAANTATPVVAPAAPVQQRSARPATKITTDLTAPRFTTGTVTYRCGNGGMITIQNLGTSLRVVGQEGATEEFAASPANQSSRYQAVTHDAIVIDGREALVMKKGSTPQTCTR
ncbi:hypothetical protein LB557_23145 [Mesorhizobium sp. BR115XR7A]|uniref:hypothetical protein n=1 Tax=Mesorhizobium sp. BR115XR7A TaxID=2876645 RepID=UPI001CCEF68F|nr:hypothetical protein [Mesorhizobium sp. BR115XR7A]MBZ9908908.1 hypothetical protein [Mesorhizobium sp. BR115XR7A]MBZ9930688.1 hypothetical protein [Mesorhizobium sp. BR1-1-5]